MLFSNFHYPFSNRKLPYRSEVLEISPSELIEIDSFLSKPKSLQTPFFRTHSLKSPKKIIIDTDIGTDIDDVLALLLTLNLDKNTINLLGITTNYYPTLLRKRIAEEILLKAHRNVKVVAGPSALCGTHREYFHHGNEGLGLGLPINELKDLWAVNDSLEAPEFIYQLCKENPGEITIISIGIPTNIGLCTYLHKDFEDLVGHIVIMGGGSVITENNISSIKCKPIFKLPKNLTSFIKEINEIKGFQLFPNHNISGDTLASKFLFSCKCPISLIPHQVTSQLWLQGLSIETLLFHQEKPLKELNEIPLCGKLLYEWLHSRWGQRGQCPHDPLTVYEAIYTEESPDDRFVKEKSMLSYVRGWFIVHEWAGYMTFIIDDNGGHRMAVSVKEGDKWLKWLEEKLIENVPKEMRCEKWKGKI